MNLLWSVTPEYLYGGTSKFIFTNKIAIFDLDNTLITTKDEKKFPVDENDWKWRFPNTKDKLKDLVDQNFCIIILSNQGGIANGKQTVDKWTKKLNQIVKELNISIRVFCSTGNNKYKKPFPTFFHEFIPNILAHELDFKKSFFCGDAAGRKGDFSDTDYKFALNCMLNFKTPEEYFQNTKIKLVSPSYPNIMTSSKNQDLNFTPKNKELIIMVGFPASGKSTVSRKISDEFKYCIINQDTLKTITKCINIAKMKIKEQKSIIIDATNPSKSVRKQWIDLAHKNNYTVRICKMLTSEQLSMHNNAYRCYKTNKNMIPTIAYKLFKSKFESPCISEGVTEIIEITPSFPNDLSYYNYLV
jgi:bifunctional polynucleotide phosphatase/kinase